jgi:hypothetical protein
MAGNTMKSVSIGMLAGLLLSAVSPTTEAVVVVEESAKLVVPEPGYEVSSVAVSAHEAVIVATRETPDGETYYASTFYFERVGTSWVFQAKLIEERYPTNSPLLRTGVAVEGGVVAFASSYSNDVVIVEKTATGWARTDVPGPNDAGLAWDVEIDGGTVLVGARAGDPPYFAAVAYRKNASGQ